MILATGIVGVDPGTKILGQQVGEGQEQVGHVALGIDDQGGDAIEGRFFQQDDTQAGLAAAGHAQADGVGRQVAGIIVHSLIEGLALRQVILLSQIEACQSFFHWFHGFVTLLLSVCPRG